MMRFIFNLGLSLLILISCAKKQNKNVNAPNPQNKSPQKPTESSLQQNSEPIRTKLLHDEAPNSYFVRLEWDIPKTTTGLALKRIKLGGTRQKQVEFLSASESSFVDEYLEANSEYLYELSAMTESSTFVVGEAKVFVPLDLEVKNEMNLPDQNGTLNLGRLIMSKGSRLKTLGKNVKLTVNELVAEDSVIDTTPMPETAPDESPGNSGGSFILKISDAKGKMHIQSRGQNGGIGLNGAPGGSGTKGDKGSPGRSHRSGGGGGRYGGGAESRSEVCDQAPGNGGKGGRGGDGSSGTSGGNGGDSANVFVSIAKLNGFQIDYDIMPGTGGNGGQGGPGGGGGPGGESGDRDKLNICPPAGSGPQGDSGNAGSDGARGSDGKKNPVCLNLENIIYGDCDKFSEGGELK